MFNEPRARVTRRRPAVAKSHEAGAERGHVYSILAATKISCDDDGDSTRWRHLGDNVPIERTQNPVKSLAKFHVTKKPKSLTKFAKS